MSQFENVARIAYTFMSVRWIDGTHANHLPGHEALFSGRIDEWNYFDVHASNGYVSRALQLAPWSHVVVRLTRQYDRDKFQRYFTKDFLVIYYLGLGKFSKFTSSYREHHNPIVIPNGKIVTY